MCGGALDGRAVSADPRLLEERVSMLTLEGVSISRQATGG